MRLDSRALSLATGIVAAALFTLCAIAVALAPDFTTSLAGSLVHVDLTPLARTITWGGYFIGLVCWGVGTALVFAAVGGLYNRLLGPSRRAMPADVAAPRPA